MTEESFFSTVKCGPLCLARHVKEPYLSMASMSNLQLPAHLCSITYDLNIGDSDLSINEAMKQNTGLWSFLAYLHFSAEELLLYPGISIGVRMQNVRANVKVLEFKSFCIFSCILTVLTILIKPLTTKAYGRWVSGDCGTSGINSICWWKFSSNTPYNVLLLSFVI